MSFAKDVSVHLNTLPPSTIKTSPYAGTPLLFPSHQGTLAGEYHRPPPGFSPISEELEAEHDVREDPRGVRKILEAIDICAKVLPPCYMKPIVVRAQLKLASLVLANGAVQSDKVFLSDSTFSLRMYATCRLGLLATALRACSSKCGHAGYFFTAFFHRALFFAPVLYAAFFCRRERWSSRLGRHIPAQT